MASVATISLTACGGSSADPVATQAKTSIAKELTANATTASDPFKDATKASCVANNVVDKIGTKALIGYGLIDAQGNATKAKLDSAKASKADATSLVDSLFSCAGPELMAQFQTTMAGREASAPPAAKACLTALFTEDTFRTILVAQMEGSSSADAVATMKDIQTKAAACAAMK
ncbi:hypothetical protein Back2_29140 [Nocardioides baekrokdamisoli]|uniref:Uncharacterized protein n=1 Tax=Nocardioides baekrokdamisoli TaxID=1804624 RepID=A0A3G9II26_9ACTN|nr:hypothetical protein Back2_29140 [Nocardioides baekrokdamisoli]